MTTETRAPFALREGGTGLGGNVVIQPGAGQELKVWERGGAQMIKNPIVLRQPVCPSGDNSPPPTKPWRRESHVNWPGSKRVRKGTRHIGEGGGETPAKIDEKKGTFHPYPPEL